MTCVVESDGMVFHKGVYLLSVAAGKDLTIVIITVAQDNTSIL